MGGLLQRSDVEGWLAQNHIEEVAKNIEEATMQRSTLTWAKIAGIGAIAGVIISAIGIAVTIWLAK